MAANRPTKVDPPKPGMHFDVPEVEYRAWDAFHYSAVKWLLRSPMHWAYNEQHPRQTADMIFGSLVDTLLFEPDEQGKRFSVRPRTYVKQVTHGRGANKVTEQVEKPFNLNSNTCKEIMAALEASGLTIVSEDDMDRARAVVKAIKAHPLIADWLARGRFQVSMVWVDAETGVLCKARLDLLCEPGEGQKLGDVDLLIADLKKSHNASRNSFRRTMTNFWYHVQGGLYQDGYATLHGGLCPPYYLMVAEDEPPHGVAAYPVGPDSLATGLRRAREAMVIWQAMREGGDCVGYPVVEDDIDVLPYALDRDLGDFNG